MDLLSILSHRIAALLSAPEIVVAYSGGIDSQVLLHAMTQLRKTSPTINLKAIHIHHGLSRNADKWLAFCEQQCRVLNVPLHAIHVSVDETGDGIEAAARQARYEALISATAKGGVLMTAHHADDQVETLLLQLKRGAGPKGLAGIAPLASLSDDKSLLRPLLDVSRQDIERYAEEHQLEWVEDESNQDTRFERNFLRKQVLPALYQQWPHLVETASRTAALCAQQTALVEQAAQDKLSGLCGTYDALEVDGLLSESSLWQAEILRSWLQSQGYAMPSRAQMAEINKMIHAKDDAEPLINLKGLQIRRFRGRLYCVESADRGETLSQSVDDDCVMPLHGQSVDLEFQNRQITVRANPDLRSGRNQYVCVHPPKVTENTLSLSDFSAALPGPIQLSVRSDRLASSFKPKGAQHSKPLKQWFKQWGVAPWSRQHTAQIWAGSTLIAIVIEGRLLAAHS